MAFFDKATDRVAEKVNQEIDNGKRLIMDNIPFIAVSIISVVALHKVVRLESELRYLNAAMIVQGK